MRDKVTGQCPQITTFEEKGEPKQIRTEVPLLTSLTPYRKSQPAHSDRYSGEGELRPTALWRTPSVQRHPSELPEFLACNLLQPEAVGLTAPDYRRVATDAYHSRGTRSSSRASMISARHAVMKF